jgi:hypothetical protein
MADVESRVVTGADGEVALYLFSTDKTPGGASKRYANLSVEDGEIVLLLGWREPDAHDVSEVTASTLGAALMRAFLHVQR